MADRRFEKVLYYRKAIKLRIKRAFWGISEVFSCISKGFFGKIRGLFKKQAGVAAILVAACIPLFILSVNYLIKYTQKSKLDTTIFEVPYIIGRNVAGAFDPGKSWSDQKDYLYSIAAQTYNDLVHTPGKSMIFQVEKVIKAGSSKETTSVTGLFDFYRRFCTLGRKENSDDFIEKEKMFIGRPPFSDFSYNEANGKVSYTKYSVNSNGTAYSVSKYKEDSNKLSLSLNNGVITVTCPKLGKIARVTLPRNDVDIIVAIPTNNVSTNTSSPQIRQMARATQEFLKKFLHTAGVAVGIVPYSGKVSLSPKMAKRGLTTPITMSNNPGDLTYAVQAIFYGSDGRAGGYIAGSNYNYYYGDIHENWGLKGNTWYECPIMARRGVQSKYRDKMTINSGASDSDSSLLLDMSTDPAKNDNNYKFMQMNRNPCYLGFCNTLAMACERDCPIFKSNPYFMTELTSDISGLIYDMELLLPFDDPKNKSNFLFLPIVMAGNLLSWGSHPSTDSTKGENERVTEKSRENKKRVVIIIANAPDHFEPLELTYLGFNNDYSEIPMIESDTILFDKVGGYVKTEDDNGNVAYKGAKGAVQFTAEGGKLTSNNGYYFTFNQADPGKETKARISFLNKGLLKIVTRKPDIASVTVYDDNGVTQWGEYSLQWGKRELDFDGPQQVKDWTSLGTTFESGNYTTKGPNFGHNLSVKKVKIKLNKCKLDKATLTNQILRYYDKYENIDDKDLIKNPQPIDLPTPTTNMPLKTEKTKWTENMDPGLSVTGNIIYNPDVEKKYILSTDYDFKKDFDCGWSYSLDLSKNPVLPNNYDEGYKREHMTCSCFAEKEVNSEILKGLGVCGFKISSSGMQNWKFIAAMDHFKVNDGKLGMGAVTFSIAGDSTFTDKPTLGTNENEETVEYDTSDETKYKVFTNATFKPNSIRNYIFYTMFATKKSRSRTITHTVTTERAYKKAPSTIDYTNWNKLPCCSPKLKEVKYYTYDCKETCTLNKKGTDECKGMDLGGGACFTLFRDKPYWCGTKVRTYAKDDKGNIYDDSGFKCSIQYHDTSQIEMKNKGYTCQSPECKPIEHTSTIASNDFYTEPYDCVGVCWDPHVKEVTGWNREEKSRTIACRNQTRPRISRTDIYSAEQKQESYQCQYLFNQAQNFDNISANNSVCNYYLSPEPYDSLLISDNVTYFNCEMPDKETTPPSCSCSGTPSYSSNMNRKVDSWKEVPEELEYLLASYQRREDGTTNFPKYYMKDKTQTYGYGQVKPGQISELKYAPTLRSTSEGKLIDNALAPESLVIWYYYIAGTGFSTKYRYNLHNFFVVSKDTKSTTYEWSDKGILTGAKDGSGKALTILNEDMSEEKLYEILSKNEGIYLLPVKGEENTYWVCFCGDADLKLEFSEAYQSSVQFSNIEAAKIILQGYGPNQEFTQIERQNYDLYFANEKRTTVGIDVNTVGSSSKTFYILPHQILDNTDDNENYYVDLKIKGTVYIKSIELTNRPLVEKDYIKYYDHPNIINDNLINTRIIDGNGQFTNDKMKLYGNINYNGNEESSLKVSPIRNTLYYNKKTNIYTRYIYPNKTGSTNDEDIEEGDFFIQLWDYDNHIPYVEWTVKDKILDKDINDSDFGLFKSGYYFSGLHRTFFPYTIYDKQWTGYSNARYSALVFAGYTLPINCILASNEYQKTFTVNNEKVNNENASYIKSDDALKNLAVDACKKLKTDLKSNNEEPTVYLVNYNTDLVNYMSDCANYVLSVKNEEELTTVLKEIASDIEENNITNELKVEVDDLNELTSGLSLGE